MNIILKPEVERLVKEKVARGEYDTADDFVDEAVRRLIDEEQEDDADRAEIRADIDAAEAEIDRGDYVEYDENTIHELARDVHERGLKRLAAERKEPGVRG
jgi:putative addiction module CopG family antidote